MPRGVQNKVAISKSTHTIPPRMPSIADDDTGMVVQFVEQKLREKSEAHQASLSELKIDSQEKPLSDHVVFLEQTSQLQGMNTIIQNADTKSEEFIFYVDRLGSLLIER